MPHKIDFNCDMGESFGMYKMGLDEEVIKYISSANIACGFHAGDPGWMRRTVRLAEEHGVAVGAHPSFPDLIGFGRRAMTVTPDEARADLVYQMGALQAFTRDKKLQHVKPHGAMYNQAVVDEDLAKAICEALLEVDEDLVLVALAQRQQRRRRVHDVLGVGFNVLAHLILVERGAEPTTEEDRRQRLGIHVKQEAGAPWG